MSSAALISALSCEAATEERKAFTERSTIGYDGESKSGSSASVRRTANLTCIGRAQFVPTFVNSINTIRPIFGCVGLAGR